MANKKVNGWQKDFDIQRKQLIIIKKLYAENGLVIIGGGACPEQYDVFKDGEQVAYYRLRHGEFTIDYPNVLGLTILSADANGDGIFDKDERVAYLSKAMELILLKL